MEHFYRSMRRRYRLLLDEHEQPVGGQWNFDHDNRKPWPGTLPSLRTGVPSTTTARSGKSCSAAMFKASVTRRRTHCVGR
jgi:deoxyribodipyrimidine photolyase-like uncharacterized protein